MKGVLCWMLATLALSGCTQEIQYVDAPTQVMLRIYCDDADLLEAMTEVRATLSVREGERFTKRAEIEVSALDLKWPVDIPIVPSSKADTFRQFEVVIDAVSRENVVAQARAIASFVPNERRVLQVSLFVCPGHQLSEGFICAREGCSGQECEVCSASGKCESVSVTSGANLSPLGDGGADMSSNGTSPSARDGSVATQTDASYDNGGCPTGEQRTGNGECDDRNECALGEDDCDDDPGACVNRPAASGEPYVCNCPAGYKGTVVGPSGCNDIDECGLGIDECDAAAPCKNLPGAYQCGDCAPGFAGGTSGCVDIDECKNDNGSCGNPAHVKCLNKEGAPPACDDINECLVSNGGCGDGTLWKCTNQDKSAPACSDIDECLASNGGCGSPVVFDCTNNVGAVPTCSDINECASNTDGCDSVPDACVNVGGGFSCGCPSGYTGNGLGENGCSDINECLSGNGGCGDASLYQCTNNPGGAPSCSDVDECLTNNGGCGGGVCTNNVGQAPTCQSGGCTFTKDVFTDPRVPLTFVRQYTPPEYTYSQAVTYCSGLVLGGFSDWRLPQQTELPRTEYCGRHAFLAPTEGATFFFGNDGQAGYCQWSNNNFPNCGSSLPPVDGLAGVWCVRP